MHGTKICDALRGRHLLRFRYRDHLTATVVEPYTYGINKKGHQVLSAWLITGETHDVHPPFWRLYLETDMSQVEVLDDRFENNRRGYNPNAKEFEHIQCRIAPPGVRTI